MKLSTIARRFLVPSFVVSIVYGAKYGCMISPRAEVELTSNLTIGKRTKIGSFTKIKASDGKLSIGADSFVSNNCFITADAAGVSIGDFVMIAASVSVIGNNYRYDDLSTPVCMQEKTSKGIVIGDDVWIGAGCVILDGSEIGPHCIIAPNSTVSGEIPANSIVQGNPAVVVFERR
jgi:acetyltransferase-like isoleucine patch superfamily enzyme